jgi:secondary thiamine-phosphate synthase enzyme
MPPLSFFNTCLFRSYCVISELVEIHSRIIPSRPLPKYLFLFINKSLNILHMALHKKDWNYNTRGKGIYEITEAVEHGLNESKLSNGIASIFIRHTSCSLILMENADPSARVDLERFMEDLVPESYPHFTHTFEGVDDMPSHIKMALTRTSENIPFSNGRLQLGTWQGLFLWEHRSSLQNRNLVFSFIGE